MGVTPRTRDSQNKFIKNLFVGFNLNKMQIEKARPCAHLNMKMSSKPRRARTGSGTVSSESSPTTRGTTGSTGVNAALITIKIGSGAAGVALFVLLSVEIGHSFGGTDF
jgi:hypothetical protein